MDLSEKMLNVRRATRLLASYYRRVMTILGMVERTLEQQKKLKLKFHRWSSIHHRDMGKQSTNPLGRWGWDFLPLQDAYFMWTTGGGVQPLKTGSVVVFVQHESDDGYEKPDDGTEPDPSEFKAAEKAESWFYVYAYGLARGKCANSWWEVAEVGDEAVADDEDWSGNVCVFEADALDGLSVDGVLQYWGLKVPMSELALEADVEVKIIAPLVEALRRLVVPPPS